MWKKIVAGFFIVFALIALIRVAGNNPEPFHIRTVLEYFRANGDFVFNNPFEEVALYIAAAHENMVESSGSWYNPFATTEYYLRLIASPLILLGFIVKDIATQAYSIMRVVASIFGF